MKRNIPILVFLFSYFVIRAQYITPGTGVNWTMDDLVANSGGVVVLNPDGEYEIAEDLTIVQPDTLSLPQSAVIRVSEETLVTFNGIILTTLSDEDTVVFSGINTGEFFKGVRFENSEGSYLKNVMFYSGGGIKLVSSEVYFENCHFSDFNQDYCTGTIDLFQSNPVLLECSFQANKGPAVLSAANGASSPQICYCSINNNVTGNANMPQINLGTSGADSIRIIGCNITGNPELTQVGGIAITTLAGGSIKARIEGNTIHGNRYGITQYGNNIGSLISNNLITVNNIQGEPMLGGSGINFYGNNTNQSIVTRNIITGNLWGITIQNSASPNFGDLNGIILNPGLNQFFNNGNSGDVYDLYNNTPNPIKAENNYWGTMDPDTVEMHIYHQPDDPTLGSVDFMPLYDIYTNMAKKYEHNRYGMIEKVFPNPADDLVTIHLKPEHGLIDCILLLIGSGGKQHFIKTLRYPDRTIQLPLTDVPGGQYLITIINNKTIGSVPLMILR